MIICMENASPRLADLLRSFPMISLATSAQGKELAVFMEEHSMSTGSLEVTFTRGSDYFGLLAVQGERSLTMCIRSPENALLAVGSLSTRSSFLRGKPAVVGYLQDLRVSKTVSAVLRQKYYEFFTEFIRLSPSLPDLDFCKYFYTAILSSNVPAKAALSRERFTLEYSKLFSYQAWIFPKIPGLSLLASFQSVDVPTKEEVIAFYNAELGSSMYDLDPKDIERVWEYSKPICLREHGIGVAFCLLVDMNRLREMKVLFKKMNLNLSLSSTQVFALRVAKKVSHKRKAEVKSALLKQAILKSYSLKSNLLAYMQVENDIEVGSHLLFKTKVATKGDIYRVFHPDHTSLEGFVDGFLRPAHTATFEWVMS
ncbi:MAG: hypothetical protein WCI18_09780 [Pseudomonadota bacterium]